MARLHGCTIDVAIKRFGHTTTVKITPTHMSVEVDQTTQEIPALPAKKGDK